MKNIHIWIFVGVASVLALLALQYKPDTLRWKKEILPIEGFQSPSIVSGPAMAPSIAAPAMAPSTPLAPSPACVPRLTYNPDGNHVYTCDGKIVLPPTVSRPPLPAMLQSITTSDGIDVQESIIEDYWLMNQGQLPPFFQEWATVDNLSDSDKTQLADWIVHNTPAKPYGYTGISSTGFPEFSEFPQLSNSKTGTIVGTTGTTGTTGTAAMKAPTAGISATGTTGTTKTTTDKTLDATKNTTCPTVDLNTSIRKDRIPCWGCSLDIPKTGCMADQYIQKDNIPCFECKL